VEHTGLFWSYIIMGVGVSLSCFLGLIDPVYRSITMPETSGEGAAEPVLVPSQLPAA
jgi:hypothetical protein